jgi:TRAP-type mannitol/chloroaromatic compound transport system permease small subunit
MPTAIMNLFLRIIDGISVWTGKLISWVVLIVVVFVIYEIIMRHFFHLPTLWVSESMVFGCGVTYVLGAAWALKENRHVRIDLVYGRLNPRQRAVMDAVTFAFFALYLSVFLWATTKYAWRSVLLGETSGSPWNPPVYPIKVALAVGVTLLILQGIAKFVRDLHFAITGREL